MNIQLFQKMLSGRTTNVNCLTAIARLKRNVGVEYLTIIPRARMGYDSEAMRARGIIVLVKSN